MQMSQADDLDTLEESSPGAIQYWVACTIHPCTLGGYGIISDLFIFFFKFICYFFLLIGDITFCFSLNVFTLFNLNLMELTFNNKITTIKKMLCI